MDLVFRYFGYAVAALVGFVAVTVSRFPHLELVQYVPELLMVGTAAVIALAALAFAKEDSLSDRGKTVLMKGLLIVILLPSVFTAGAFVHEVQTTWSNGEVHYHADFEVVVEGEQLDLINPEQYCDTLTRESSYMCSINDRVGTTEYHEHADDRIHLEGVFKTKDDASLAAFFEAFQGELTEARMRFPTNDGWVDVEEEDGKTLKILVNRGVGGARGWCILGEPDVPTENTCIDAYSDAHVTGPADYVISPRQTDPLDDPVLDKIWIIYDETPAEQAMQDLAEDGEYTYNGQTFQMTKSGEGYE